MGYVSLCSWAIVAYLTTVTENTLFNTISYQYTLQWRAGLLKKEETSHKKKKTHGENNMSETEEILFFKSENLRNTKP